MTRILLTPSRPIFNKDSHKGERGKVLIVAGSSRYYGAPIFNALAAEAAGADLITLFLPESHSQSAKNYSLNLFIRSFVSQELGLKDIGLILQELEGNNVLLLGSGIDQNLDALKVAKHIIGKSKVPVVLDGTLLQPEILSIQRSCDLVITPHKGEFRRMFLEEATTESVVRLASAHNLFILCKGHVDIIATPQGEYLENHTGSPKMRVGGTGDALAGVVASYIAQGMGVLDAIYSGAHYFGLCGERLSKHQYSLTTLEVIRAFSRTDP